MAQPLKPAAKSQHAGKARKPPVIDLEAEKDKIHPAEPIGFDAPQEIPMTHLRQDDKNNEIKDTSAETSQRTQKVNMTSRNSSFKAVDQNSATKKRGCGSLLLSGFTGGVVALILGGGLQWAGILPLLSKNSSTLESRMGDIENEIANLRQKTAEDAAVTSELSSDDSKTVGNIENAVGELEAKNNELSQQLSSVIDNVEVLNNVINSLGKDGTAPQAPDALVTKLDTLDHKVQSLSLFSDKADRALNLGQNNAKNIAVFDKQLKDITTELKTSIQGKEIAAITAANALKNAIDRGGSYVNEWKTLQAVMPEASLLEDLKQNADKGIPNQAELSAEFADVADQIAATENRADDDAGLSKKLWTRAKGLVSSRPIGNVEGNSASAIAARMEQAIKQGDNERALSEWQNLPQDAKDISAKFVEKLTLRRDADAILSRILSEITSSATSQQSN